MLGNHGFQTSTATNRHEALGVVRENPVELAVVNISLPGAEGIATILAVLAYAPTMKIIAISGGPAEGAGDLLPLARSLGAMALPGNPLDQGNLPGAIHDLLAPGLRQLAS
jgi:DNA-binding NtrC family response regulator